MTYEPYPCCEHCPDDCPAWFDHTEPCAHGCDGDPSDEFEDNLSDVEADHMTLVSAGWGSDEDYGYYGEADY